MVQNLPEKLLDILKEYEEISTSDLTILLSIDKKRLWYELDQLNDVLSVLRIERIIQKDGWIKSSMITTETSNIIKNYIGSSEVISADYRGAAIVLFTLTNNEWSAVSHYEELLGLSRNSVLNELKKVKDDLAKRNLSLNYDRNNGYTIQGDELEIRILMEHVILKLLSYSNHEIVFKRIHHIAVYKKSTEEVITLVNTLAQSYKIAFVMERFYEVVHMLNCLSMSRTGQSVFYDEATIHYFKRQRLYEMALDLCKFLEIKEKNDDIFITMRLMAAVQGSQDIVEDFKLLNMTSEIIQRVNVLTLGGLDHVEQESLFSKLYEHLVPSYYRLKYHIALTDEFTLSIKNDYPDLFDLVARALKPLAVATACELPDNEIAYFTIHFGGYLRTKKQKKQGLRAITVCSNGVSSSLLLDAQLRTLFPTIDFVGIYTLNSVDSLDFDAFDIIFSTIHFETSKPLFVTKSIMNWVEEEMLRKQVNDVFNLDESKRIQVIDNVIRTVSKHVQISDKEALFKDLVTTLYYPQLELEATNLEDLLKEDFICYTNESLTWEEGIKKASQHLLENGYIESSYIDAMIAKVKEIGPYIVLAPMVAIPHARPEDGANKMGISLLVSSKPIIFDFPNDERLVRLIFVLSATDTTSHLTALQQLSYLLEDEENIDKMIELTDRHALYEFIDKHSKEPKND